jgi:transglutaminase-like putative cysteine protease
MKLNFPFLVLPLFMSLLLLSCSSESFINLNSLKEQLSLKDFPEQKDYPEADALVLMESHEVNLKNNDDYNFETTEKIQNVTKLFRNIEDYSSIQISLRNGDKLSSLKARTIKPDGSVIELNSDDYHTITGGGYSFIFYTDEKTVKFTFPSIEKNCIIEYQYLINKVRPYVINEWEVQSYIPKLKNIFKLTAPKVLSNNEHGYSIPALRYKNYNCTLKGTDLNNNNSGTNQNYKNSEFAWELNNIPAFEPEPKMPPHSNYIQYVMFTPTKWKSWNDISEWYYNHIYKPQLIISDEISAKARELTKDCNNELDKIKTASSYVQKIRYVAIEIGEGGVVPSTPQQVLDHKYGDCKDKSTLLVGLLRSLNIKAKPVLVLTADDGRVDTTFPSWKFNHMIVKAYTKEGKEFWIDPTISHCRLGELSSQCKNIDVLVLNDDGTTQLETTPASNYNDNTEDIVIKINLTNTDSTNLDVAIKYKGEYDIEHRYHFDEKTRTEMLKYCKSIVSDKYLNAKVLDYSISNIDSVDSDLVLNFKLYVPNLIERQGDFIFLNLDPFQLPGNWKWLGREKRTYDIEFDYPYTVNKTIEVILPENKFQLKNIPSNTINSWNGLYYSKNYELPEKNKIIIKEKFSVAEKDINVSKYIKVRNFMDGIKAAQNELIILTSK